MEASVHKFSRTQSDLYGVTFFTPSLGWVSGEAGTILHTKDGGLTWMDQASGSNAILYAIHFADKSHGSAVGALGTILMTDDGGGRRGRCRTPKRRQRFLISFLWMR